MRNYKREWKFFLLGIVPIIIGGYVIDKAFDFPFWGLACTASFILGLKVYEGIGDKN